MTTSWLSRQRHWLKPIYYDMNRRQRFAQRWMFFWTDSWYYPQVVDRLDKWFGEKDRHYPSDWWIGLPCRLIPGTHDPIHDQCCIPAHDFCAWCQKSMPGQAPIHQTGESDVAD